ncbi:MAG: hypothetical protein QNJ11_00580 [Woeseiaceae bacterium]|nr:hypothetical protein [Woeseiaceae bacterium]
MRTVIVATALLFALFSPLAMSAKLAKITSMEYGASGAPEMYTIMYADADGNLRIEGYGIISTATSSGMATSSGGNVKMNYKPGDLRDLMVFQAAERRMLFFDRGQCRVMNTEGPDATAMPGLPPDAMAKMQAAIAEMEKENPELAKMMKEKAGASNMLGSMMREPRETIVEETGDDRTIGDYDTMGFKVYEEGAEHDVTLVWAADIDDVEGGRLVGNAMVGFFGAFKDMMESMGAGGLASTGTASAVMEKMEDFYPIETKHPHGRSTLISAEMGGEAEFYPDCQ